MPADVDCPHVLGPREGRRGTTHEAISVCTCVEHWCQHRCAGCRSAATAADAARSGDLHSGRAALQLDRLLYRRQSWRWLDYLRRCFRHARQYIHANNNAQFLGGGQVGVNYEFWGGVVVGAEAMFDWLPNNSNTITATAPSGATASLSINNRWITTATGKLGYAWDRVLFYGKGGGAWVGSNSPGITTAAGVPLGLSNTNSNLGWTAGLGVEWAFWNNWSARAEWDYVRLNSQTFTVTGTPAPGSFAGDVFNNNNRQINMFTAGVNYKFGWGW